MRSYFTFMPKLTILVCLILLCGCQGTREVVREVPVHDTTYIAKVQHDSTYIDRWHEVIRKGDTVYDTKVINKYRDRTVHDTVKVVEEIPVEVETERVVEVEKPLSSWQRFLLLAGKIALILVAIGFFIGGLYLYHHFKPRK